MVRAGKLACSEAVETRLEASREHQLAARGEDRAAWEGVACAVSNCGGRTMDEESFSAGHETHGTSGWRPGGGLLISPGGARAVCHAEVATQSRSDGCSAACVRRCRKQRQTPKSDKTAKRVRTHRPRARRRRKLFLRLPSALPAPLRPIGAVCTVPSWLTRRSPLRACNNDAKNVRE